MEVLDPRWDVLAGLEEERGWAFDQLLGTELLLAVRAVGVLNHAVLPVRENGQVDQALHFLVHSRAVRLSVIVRDEPLLAVSPRRAVGVGEGANGPKVNRLSFRDHERVHHGDDALVDPGEVRPGCVDHPLLPSDSLGPSGVGELLLSSQPEGLERANHSGADDLNLLHTRVRGVRARPLEEPLVTSHAAGAARVIAVEHRPQLERGVREHHREWGDAVGEHLPRVQWERVLGQSDLLLSVP
mmetsp:Transcript_24836/g.64671  ORF Transcript_24836/g.64671 Transcript_24836/m.64671 type:complete len:242 (+) Transcript_24836:1765-2490(+)